LSKQPQTQIVRKVVAVGKAALKVRRRRDIRRRRHDLRGEEQRIAGVGEAVPEHE
jgi:hypothetical protein